ncbi:MAG TPA: hypothetical protein VJC16_02865 [Candidatus Nanoarchaeia archaeon]|nr:hypothetical protein [Candidatus Nanoarchaeia archaeon]
MEQAELLFKENVDAWIKQIRNELSEFQDIPAVVEENINNIQHNYELIQEMKDEVEDLKQEVKLLKIMHILVLKQKNEPMKTPA